MTREHRVLTFIPVAIGLISVGIALSDLAGSKVVVLTVTGLLLSLITGFGTYSAARATQHAERRLTEPAVETSRGGLPSQPRDESTGFDSVSLTDVDLSDRDLADSSFRRAVLDRVNFSRCRLEHADFSAASLASSSFVQAGLRTASFESARLSDCDFSGARLEGVRFSQARLSEVSLAGAHASFADFRDARLANVSLVGASLEGASFTRASLADVNLADADKITDLDLSEASLAGKLLDGRTILTALLRDTRVTVGDTTHSAIIDVVVDALTGRAQEHGPLSDDALPDRFALFDTAAFSLQIATTAASGPHVVCWTAIADERASWRTRRTTDEQTAALRHYGFAEDERGGYGRVFDLETEADLSVGQVLACVLKDVFSVAGDAPLTLSTGELPPSSATST